MVVVVACVYVHVCVCVHGASKQLRKQVIEQENEKEKGIKCAYRRI